MAEEVLQRTITQAPSYLQPGIEKYLEGATAQAGQAIDITFENPGSTFKDFLAVIPKTYAKNLDNVDTTGNFKINGVIKGESTETTIPTLDINIVSNNASFKFADLLITDDLLIKKTYKT